MSTTPGRRCAAVSKGGRPRLGASASVTRCAALKGPRPGSVLNRRGVSLPSDSPRAQGVQLLTRGLLDLGDQNITHHDFREPSGKLQNVVSHPVSCLLIGEKCFISAIKHANGNNYILPTIKQIIAPEAWEFFCICADVKVLPEFLGYCRIFENSRLEILVPRPFTFLSCW
jgi:hypothetical protein